MVSPEFLREKLKQKIDAFDHGLPELLSLMTPSHKLFDIQHFIGIEWLKVLYDNIANSSTDLMARLGADHIQADFKKYLYEVYLPKRVGRGIRNRVILHRSPDNTYFADPKNVDLTETVFVDQWMFHLDCEMVLFDGDKVSIALMSPNEMAGIQIQSKNLYNSRASIFEMMRQTAKSHESV